MWSKFFTVTVQAINKRAKMSLLSEPAIFEVKNFTDVTGNDHLPYQAPNPIHGMSAKKASWDEIELMWPEMPDAADYKLYWDKGAQDSQNIISVLAASTNRTTSFKVDHKNSGGILGSEYVQVHGGVFKFRVGYIQQNTKKES